MHKSVAYLLSKKLSKFLQNFLVRSTDLTYPSPLFAVVFPVSFTVARLASPLPHVGDHVTRRAVGLDPTRCLTTD